MTLLIGFLVQLTINLVFISLFIMILFKFKKSNQEDPKISSSLQLLQDKIIVLEDLGDRTEQKVIELSRILESKLIEVQKKVEQADKVLGQIGQSMEKSLEVAKIFQDKIPHNEIVERQNTVKFVKAALMANQGHTADEIAQVIDLSRGEIEFLIKVNKEELSFDESQLPEWVVSELKDTKLLITNELEFIEPIITKPKFKTSAGISDSDQLALKQLGEKFRQAQFIVQDQKEKIESLPQVEQKNLISKIDNYKKIESASKTEVAKITIAQKAKEMGIRPVVFPRIESPN